MTTQPEALRQLANKFSEGWHDGIKIDASDIMLLTDVATALRERLAREEDSNCQHCGGKGCVACDARQEQAAASPDGGTGFIGGVWHQPARQEQEPVAYVVRGIADGKLYAQTLHFDIEEAKKTAAVFATKYPMVTTGPLFGIPSPARQWQGLTDEERENIWRADQMTSAEWDELFSTVEAKLKEKNA